MPKTTDAAVRFAPTPDGLDAVLDALDVPGSGAAVAPELRRHALRRYAALPAPGGRPGRSWRHDYDKLDFSGLRWTTGSTTIPTSPFEAAAELGAADADADVPALATENAGGLVHVGARVIRQASPQTPPRGVVVVPLADAGAGGDPGEALRAALATDRFAALATAFQNCGAFVYVTDGVILDKPIQLVFATPEAADDAVFPQIVVVVGAGARATIIERHIGTADAFVCGTTFVRAHEDAQVDYVAIQQCGEAARAFSYRRGACGRGAQVRFHVAELGATLARSVVDVELESDGARGEIAALFFNTGLQHVDLSTTTTHAVGNTTSDTVVRTAASDRGQGRFAGNIAIVQKAHGADASLRDDALLLSRRAHIDSIPALEIAANDVKAYHGATVGSLDEDALFYASSRGIARPDAVRMVALAFFEPAIARLPSDGLRDEVRTALDGKIDDATDIDA